MKGTKGISKKLTTGIFATMMGVTILGSTSFAATANTPSTVASLTDKTATASTATSPTDKTATANTATSPTGKTATESTTKTASSVNDIKDITSVKNHSVDDLKRVFENMDNSTTKTNLEKLLATYKSKIAATEAAQKALITALNTNKIQVIYSDDNTLNVKAISSEIAKLNNTSTVTKLNKLLTAYSKALAAEDSARAALDAAVSAAK